MTCFYDELYTLTDLLLFSAGPILANSIYYIYLYIYLYLYIEIYIYRYIQLRWYEFGRWRHRLP